MDFRKAAAKYKDLQKQLKKKKINQAQFAHEISQIQVQDSQGNWWQIDPSDGSWLLWDGEKWVKGDPKTAKYQQTGLPAGGPQSLAQLFMLMIKGIGKNLPKMLIQAVIIGIIIWVVHAYLVVVVNNGYLKISSWAADIIALKWHNYNNVPKATFFWTMVGWLISYVVFTRIIGKGPLNFIKDILFTPGWVFKGFKQLGTRNIGIFLIVTALGLAMNLFIKNIYISGLIAISFFLILTSRYEGLMYLIIRLTHSDLQRLFRRNKPQHPFNDGYLIALLTGIILSVVIYLALPYRPHSAYLGAALLLGCGIFLMIKTRRPVVNMLLAAYIGFNVYWYLTTGSLAHDGGWDEYGRDFGTWWVSEGRNESLAAGNVPAAGGMLGSLLGSLGNAISSTAAAAAQTVRGAASRVAEGVSNAYQSVKETAGYAVEVGIGTLRNIGQDFAEAGRTIRDFAGKAWEGAKQAASDTAQAVKDVWNDPGIIRDTFVMTCGQIKDGVVGVVQETASLVKDVWNDPRIIGDTILGTGRDLANIASNIGSAIYTTVTDPKKAWEYISNTAGFTNFVNSWDPNRSLLERLGQVAIGTGKLYGTLLTAGKIGAVIKSGTSSAVGAVGALKTGKTAAAAASLKTGKTAGLTYKAGISQRLPIARPGDAREIAAFRNMQRQGANKVDTFINALKSKDPARIKQAALQVQGDPQAIANINGRNNFVKNQFNKQMQQVYRQTDQRVIERIAKEYGVSPDQVKVVSATNPNRSLTNVKVGFDRDITFRVGNRDVPASKLQQIYNQEFTRVTGVKDPSRLGQMAVDRFHAEAYGRGPSDLHKVLQGQAHKVADSQQIGKTITYKAQHAFQEAARSVNPDVARNHMFDGMRQISKQWNNQVLSAVKHLNSQPGGKLVKIPSRLKEAMNIMDSINHGASPAEITQRLRGLGMTPSDVATQAGEFFEAMMKLR